MSLEQKGERCLLLSFSLLGRLVRWSEWSFGTVSYLKIWRGIIMYCAADIHMRPEPQRHSQMIDIGVCARSIKFFRL